jgi:hypothetical protein
MRLSCILVAGVAAVLVGCGSEKGSQDSRPSSAGAPVVSSGVSQSKAERAATISKAVQADPDHADDVLRRNGMTEDQFEALMYEVAADPEMSREYNARMGP